jgi:hypothetical protein
VTTEPAEPAWFSAFSSLPYEQTSIVELLHNDKWYPIASYSTVPDSLLKSYGLTGSSSSDHSTTQAWHLRFALDQLAILLCCLPGLLFLSFTVLILIVHLIPFTSPFLDERLLFSTEERFAAAIKKVPLLSSSFSLVFYLSFLLLLLFLFSLSSPPIRTD